MQGSSSSGSLEIYDQLAGIGSIGQLESSSRVQSQTAGCPLNLGWLRYLKPLTANNFFRWSLYRQGGNCGSQQRAKVNKGKYLQGFSSVGGRGSADGDLEGGPVLGAQAGIRGGSGGRESLWKALQGARWAGGAPRGSGGCAAGGLRNEAHAGAVKSGQCYREWKSAGIWGCRNSMGAGRSCGEELREGAKLWVGRCGSFGRNIFGGSQKLQNHHRQNIHSLFPGCSVQRAVTRECLLLVIKKETYHSKFSAVKPKSTQYTSEEDTQLPTEMVFSFHNVGESSLSMLMNADLHAQDIHYKRSKLSCSNKHGENLYDYKRRKIWEKAIIRGGRYYIGEAIVLQEEEDYNVYSGQGIAEGRMCGARMVWYYYVLQCWRADGGGSRGKRGEEGNRIAIYAGACRVAKPLLHRAWNVWWQCRGCSCMQGCKTFISSCMECLVEACGQYSNICRGIQGCTAFIASCMECLGGNMWTAQQYMLVAAGLWLGWYGNRSPEAVSSSVSPVIRVSGSGLSSSNFVYKGLLTVFTTRITAVVH
ncbi:hypothetical protein VP01_83g5 [Puccinia sorghi]|uniref:Uncharacterized protein n=1 Tax=Puccinia sorghi TaxID=27349 RepID=A0A0L6UA59_9BASI|nr:hypothetical protein VP01_83g5 [Puccinia sorghi]